MELGNIRDRYVEPDRVRPRDMLLSALNYIQRDVAQVIVMPSSNGEVTLRVDTHSKQLRVDNVQGPSDVAAKLREVFSFLQRNVNSRSKTIIYGGVYVSVICGPLHTKPRARGPS